MAHGKATTSAETVGRRFEECFPGPTGSSSWTIARVKERRTNRHVSAVHLDLVDQGLQQGLQQ